MHQLMVFINFALVLEGSSVASIFSSRCFFAFEDLGAVKTRSVSLGDNRIDLMTFHRERADHVPCFRLFCYVHSVSGTGTTHALKESVHGAIFPQEGKSGPLGRQACWTFFQRQVHIGTV